MVPRGKPVRALAPGTIARFFLSEPGGNTIYQFDEAGVFCYCYAHLDRYADGLKSGDKVKAGQVIGYAGSTGNASPDSPDLHFAVFELGPGKEWWKGTAVNPYEALREALRRGRNH
jgi:murein DD-endopeptidase MepM/ murein hydrolase activator NlpD